MTNTEETGIRMLARAAAEFARNELAANREESDRFPFGPFFSTVLQKAFELDFFHITLPEAMGGVGMGTHALCVVLEELCRQDASLGAIVLTNCFAQEILLSAGNTDLIKDMTDRADKVTSFLLACPLFNNPSEIRHMAAVIEKDGRYFLSGKLEYLVLGGVAGAAVVPAATEGQESYSYYLIDLKQTSVAIGEPVLSLGLRCCPAVDTEFHMTEAVPVGRSGDGAALFSKAAAKLHPAAAAISSGIMKGAFDEALSYAGEREQGGRKIGEWSEMKMMLADMAVHLKIADMVVSEACRAVDGKEKGWEQKALAAAIHIQAAAVQVTTDGVQALGGVGYMQDFGQEKRFRDAKHIQACFGLTPMQRLKYLSQVTGKER
ncbi:MAG: acyl-CoA dehydrogenase family protein [Desulfobacteraceae bacterium]|jgi:alkylation response protein AidB-like acyl-CoA dehydrogenase|nr:acyl-CoA dehydrogenase family protein [Desulfobacteraceae bacterium]